MADVTLSLGVPTEVTTGSADVVRKVIFPANARAFRILARTNASKMVISSSLADGDALGTVDYESIAANTLLELPVPGCVGRARQLDATQRHIAITSATGSTVIEVTALP